MLELGLCLEKGMDVSQSFISKLVPVHCEH